MEELQTLLSAVRIAALGEKDRLSATPEVLQKVFALARAHDLSLLVAEGLERGGATLPPEVAGGFLRVGGAAFGRFCSQNLAVERLTAAFERASVDYMPLKGMVLRTLYPSPEWRVGRDVDILVRSADFERARTLATEVLSPVKIGEGKHDVGFETADGVRVELHFALFNGDEGFGDLLADPFANAECRERGHRCALPDAELYAYHIAHMAKHFYHGGCGLRAFLDLFLLRRAIGLEACAAGDALLEPAGLAGFAAAVCHQGDVFFGNVAGDDDTARLARFVVANQAFGSFASASAVALKRSKKAKSGPRRVLSRMFPAYAVMCYLYPILRRIPILLPFSWILRGFRVFSKKDRARFLAASRAAAKVGEADVAEMTQLYMYLKLEG